jgi:hypothetical protein
VHTSCTLGSGAQQSIDASPDGRLNASAMSLLPLTSPCLYVGPSDRATLERLVADGKTPEAPCLKSRRRQKKVGALPPAIVRMTPEVHDALLQQRPPSPASPCDALQLGPAALSNHNEVCPAFWLPLSIVFSNGSAHSLCATNRVDGTSLLSFDPMTGLLVQGRIGHESVSLRSVSWCRVPHSAHLSCNGARLSRLRKKLAKCRGLHSMREEKRGIEVYASTDA